MWKKKKHWESSSFTSTSHPKPREIGASYLTVSVIYSEFIKLLTQAKANLCVLESALSPDHHFVSFLTDNHCWFGHISHLPGGKAHT